MDGRPAQSVECGESPILKASRFRLLFRGSKPPAPSVGVANALPSHPSLDETVWATNRLVGERAALSPVPPARRTRDPSTLRSGQARGHPRLDGIS